MHRRQHTFSELLVRALAVAGLIYALVATYAVPATLLSSETRQTQVGDRDTAREHAEAPRWSRVHARRFPGCVDVASWDGTTAPATVVVVTLAGRPREMSFDEAYERARNATRVDDVWIIGACR